MLNTFISGKTCIVSLFSPHKDKAFCLLGFFFIFFFPVFVSVKVLKAHAAGKKWVCIALAPFSTH